MLNHCMMVLLLLLMLLAVLLLMSYMIVTKIQGLAEELVHVILPPHPDNSVGVRPEPGQLLACRYVYLIREARHAPQQRDRAADH
ncbi:MAG: hypothetical protein ACI81O_002149 [Cyclobacteriaceae bacterium]|jgi:hypothetical protein